MTMRIRRTATPDNPPTGLAPGQLAVEMNDPVRLWTGVPDFIDPSERRRIESVPDAAQDNLVHARKNADWTPVWQEVFSIRRIQIIHSAGAWFWDVPFHAPTIDLQSGWNAATNTYAPKIPGLYFFQARSWFYQDHYLALFKNDTGTWDAARTLVGARNNIFISVTTIEPMNGTTDFVRLWFWTSPSTTNPADVATPTLQAFLIGV